MTIPVNPPPPRLTPATSLRSEVLPTGEHPAVQAAPVSCAYCWEPIPAELFTDSPWGEGRLSAQCPGCDLPVTLSAVV